MTNMDKLKNWIITKLLIELPFIWLKWIKSPRNFWNSL